MALVVILPGKEILDFGKLVVDEVVNKLVTPIDECLVSTF